MNSKFYPNQRVRIRTSNNPPFIQIITKQNKSTPGGYIVCDIKKGDRYILKIAGQSKTIHNPRLWIAHNKKNIYLKPINFNKKSNYIIESGYDATLKIGILFSNPKQKEYIILTKFNILEHNGFTDEDKINDHIYVDNGLLNPIDNSRYYLNQKVSVVFDNNHVKIFPKQNKSTPGAYKKIRIKRNIVYNIVLKYTKKYKNKHAKIWIVDKKHTKVNIFNDLLKKRNVINKTICSNYNMTLKIGLLFINPKLDEYMIIEQFDIKELGKKERYTKNIDINVNDNFFSNKGQNIKNMIMYEFGGKSPAFYTNKDYENKSKMISKEITNIDTSNKISIIDIGCGAGRTLEILRKSGYNNLSGMDKNNIISTYIKNIYPELYKIIDFCPNNVTTLLNNKKIYDVAIIESLFLHLNNLEKKILIEWFFTHCKYLILIDVSYDIIKQYNIDDNYVNLRDIMLDNSFNLLVSKKLDKPFTCYDLMVVENINVNRKLKLTRFYYENYLPDSFFVPNIVIKIKWKKSLSIPLGIEETFFNISHNRLIFFCGLNGGPRFSYKKDDTDPKIKKYMNRGFKNCGYLLNLNVKEEDYKWISMPKFPGIERQAGRVVSINNILYCYGGYKFLPCKTHNPKIVFKKNKMSFRTLADGYALRYTKKKWIWNKLPDLPLSMSGFGMTKIDNYIYICCGAHRKDFFKCSQLMVKFTDINNNDVEVGKILYRLNINDPKKGWEKYDVFPGTLRFNPAFTAIDNIIYIIGGISPNHNWKISRDISDRYYNVIDNWKYDVIAKKWTLIKTDIFNNFSNWGPSNDQIVYKNRYLILIGGYAYGKIRKGNSFFKNSKHNRDFSNRIVIYDTLLDGAYNTNNNFCKINVPDYIVHQNKIYLIGSESINYNFGGECFGRHSDVFAIGEIIEHNNKINLLQNC